MPKIDNFILISKIAFAWPQHFSNKNSQEIVRFFFFLLITTCCEEFLKIATD